MLVARARGDSNRKSFVAPHYACNGYVCGKRYSADGPICPGSPIADPIISTQVSGFCLIPQSLRDTSMVRRGHAKRRSVSAFAIAGALVPSMSDTPD